MASLTSYKGVSVIASPYGAGGIALSDNFEYLASKVYREVVTLTYSSTVTTDVSTGHRFKVVLTGDFTLANPTGTANIHDGDTFEWLIYQDGVGSHLLTALGSNFRLPSSGPASLTLGTVASKHDKLMVEYNLADGKFDVVAFVVGY